MIHFASYSHILGNIEQYLFFFPVHNVLKSLSNRFVVKNEKGVTKNRKERKKGSVDAVSHFRNPRNMPAATCGIW